VAEQLNTTLLRRTCATLCDRKTCSIASSTAAREEPPRKSVAVRVLLVW
jgi:hypothetical protein